MRVGWCMFLQKNRYNAHRSREVSVRLSAELSNNSSTFLPPFSLFFPIVFLFQVAYIDLMLPWLEWICYWTRGRVKRSIWSKWEEGDVSFYFSFFYSFASSFPLNNTFSLLYTLFTLTQYFSQGIPISSSAVIVAVRACHIVYISVVAVSTNLKQSHLSSFTSDNAGRKVSGVKRI